jgi:hypothetical protein
MERPSPDDLRRKINARKSETQDKQQWKPKPGRSAHERDKMIRRRGPLPAGSMPILDPFNGLDWTGRLVVKLPDGSVKLFQSTLPVTDRAKNPKAKGVGLFQLLQHLDDLYRNWIETS